MKLFAVINTVGGFAREDASNASIEGLFTDEQIAEIVRKACGSSAKVVEVQVDEVKPGYIDFAKHVLNIDLAKIIMEKQFGIKDMEGFELDCLMSAEEFLDYADSGAFISDDGSGYWATDKKISNVSCWSQKPDWATHVCWFNR